MAPFFHHIFGAQKKVGEKEGVKGGEILGTGRGYLFAGP